MSNEKKPLPPRKHVPPHPSSFVDSPKVDFHEHLKKKFGAEQAERDGVQQHNDEIDSIIGAPDDESHSPSESE